LYSGDTRFAFYVPRFDFVPMAVCPRRSGRYFSASLENQTRAADTNATPEYRTAFFKSLLGQKLTEGESRAMTAFKADFSGLF
jgi:hypothetical protein